MVAVYNVLKITNPSSDDLWNQNYVQVASEAAARNNARFANAFDAIHTTDQICELTFLCTSGDAHPTDAGYQVIREPDLECLRLRPTHRPLARPGDAGGSLSGLPRREQEP